MENDLFNLVSESTESSPHLSQTTRSNVHETALESSEVVAPASPKPKANQKPDQDTVDHPPPTRVAKLSRDGLQHHIKEGDIIEEYLVNVYLLCVLISEIELRQKRLKSTKRVSLCFANEQLDAPLNTLHLFEEF